MTLTATYTTFANKLWGLNPSLNDGLKPGALMIAVLHHTKDANSNLSEADVLWIKCPAEKKIETITKAYVKQLACQDAIKLSHNDRMLDDTLKVSSLVRDGCSKLIALRAIAVPNDKTQHTASQPTRSPLIEITNTQRSTPVFKLAKVPTSHDVTPVRASPGHSVLSPIDRLAPVTVPASPSVIENSNPGTVVASLDRQSIQAGWANFLAERHCHQVHLDLAVNRLKIPTNSSKHNDTFAEEWLNLCEEQKAYFVERSRRLTIANDAHDAWLFWDFYYEQYFQSNGGGTHLSFEQLGGFFDSALFRWYRIPLNLRLARSQSYHFMLSFNVSRQAKIAPEYRNNGPSGANPTNDTSSSTIKQEVSKDLIASPAKVAEFPDNAMLHDSPQSNTSPDNRVRIKEDDFHVEVEDSNEVQNPGISRMSISELFDDRSPEQLESSVEAGTELLASVESALKSQPSQDTDQWIKALESVRKQAVRSRTIVGVVGATGAGKSSVINAMLDQERLVPTNCMRACTAVVTEISYNYDGNGYRAEVEFISPAEWQKQLKILFQELFDGSGKVSRDCANEESEAGVAYAQIKAVYPRLTREDIETTTVERLMKHNNVSCLGSVQKLESDDSLIFYKKLQCYVDSKEKTQKKDKDEKKAREQEYWPLIRVVRIFVKSHALSTGAVIVDLPGVHDSNQARAAVAQGYMKQCTGLWIVAPITRAVDDKSAKHLMGDTFKRQLKLDGGFSDVTFICSKTDDISLIEAQDSLGLEEELTPMWSQLDDLNGKKKQLSKSIEHLKATKGDITAAMDTVDDDIDVWNELLDQHGDGNTVYQPRPKTTKRKRPRASSPERKRAKRLDVESDEEWHEDDTDEDNDTGSDDFDPLRECLTEEDITTHLAELRSTKKHGRRERIKIEDQIKTLRGEIEELDKEIEKVEAVISSKCIAGRNAYSRDAIRQDYAAGIRELDQELAEEQDAANFDPEQDSRDYDEVARSLPVFCVSSRAYQKLKGRLAKDKSPAGFTDVDETDIPALQAHCIQMTSKTRQISCRRFLNNAFQLLNSLQLWATNDGSGCSLTKGQVAREASILKGKLAILDDALEKAVTELIDDITSEINQKLFDTMPAAVTVAKTKAGDTVSKWGGPKDVGGLYWATYKAVCRRDGVFTGSGGLHNFNAQLLEPVFQRLAGPWETIFVRRLPNILKSLPVTVGQILTAFHNDQEKRALRNGGSMAKFQMLCQQLGLYSETLKDAVTEIQTQTTEKQRDANRELEPKLQESMSNAYNVCVQEVGCGQYQRMKIHMATHVEQQKNTMFADCWSRVRGQVVELLDGVKNTLLEKVDKVYVAIEREYTSVVVGQATGSEVALSREHRVVRKSVLAIIDGAELAFKQAVGLEPKSETVPAASPGSDIPAPIEDANTVSIMKEDLNADSKDALRDSISLQPAAS